MPISRNFRIGVCSLRTDPFWLQVEAAIHQRAQDLPVDLVPVCPDDRYGTLSDVELVPGVDALLTLELDGLIGWFWPEEQIYQVLRSGLPVVHLSETSVNHPLTVSPLGLHSIARMLAAYLAERLSGRGKVLIVGGLIPEYLYDDGRSRMAGVHEALEDHPGITIDHIPSSWNCKQAWKQIRAALQELEGPFDAVLGLSDSLALAARNLGRSLGLLGELALTVGINGDPEALTAIANAEMAATAALFPEEIGSRVMDLAYQAARQRPLPSHFEYKSRLVTAENLTGVMAQKLVTLSRLPNWLVEVNQRRQQQRLDQLETSLEIISQIGSLLDSRRQLRKITELICTKYGYDRARIYRWVEEERCLYLVHPSGPGAPEHLSSMTAGSSSSGVEQIPGSTVMASNGSGQADAADPGRLIIADGLGWVGEWYDVTGESSNYVIDQIAAWSTAESRSFAQAFEARYGLQPSPSAAGLSHDYANMFIQIARLVYQDAGELSSKTLADFSRYKLQTGEWSYTGGYIMEEYRYSPETLPDPMIGPGYFSFPVVEYLQGEGMIIFPQQWADRGTSISPKGALPQAVEPVPAGIATEVFKLGVLGPFSGDSACTGAEIKGAVEMALEEIDYRIGRYEIQVVWIDSQSDPVIAAQAYEQAIVQEGIQAGLLSWHTAETVPCMKVAAKYKIPHFFGLGAGSVVNETWQSDPDKYFYWLKGWPEPPKLTANYVQLVEDAIARGLWQPEARRAALWGDETEWSRSFAKGLRGQLTAAGWEIVVECYFSLGETDFAPMLGRIKEKNPALIAGTTMNPSALSSIVRQAGELGLERMFAWSPGNQPSIPFEESGVLGQALLRNEPIYLPRGHEDLRSRSHGLRGDTRSRLVLPIRHGQHALGLLDLRSRRATWHTHMELVGLRALADQLGSAFWDAQLYGQATQARAMAEQSDQLKTRLLANVSHELRTPLNVILGYIRRAVDSLTPHHADLPSALLEDLQQVQRTAVHLLRLSNDLLDLSRAQVHQLELSPKILDPQPVLVEVFQAMADNTASTKTTWRLELPERLPMIKADPVRLRQILLNLLGNAERFTDHGQIVLGAEVAPPHLHIWVQDTGLGIPIDRQEQIFEPFCTAEHPGQRREGIGLGLPIARQLVALHYGFITLESQPGQGSTFHVYLPLPSLLDEPSSPPPSAQPVLLLVSDGEKPAPELVQFCQHQGLEIRQLPTADILDRLLAQVQPAALAWDLASTPARQRVLVERLRSYPSLCQIPFIVYGRVQGRDGEAGVGLTNFVIKPVDARNLSDAIGAMVPRAATGPILVVEDDAQARSYLASLVERGFPGYSVRTAEDGVVALDLVAQELPSLVVLDLMLPGVDGFQVLEQMRADERTSQVPILILTGHLLSVDDIKRLEQHAWVTVHSKGILSDDEISAALHRSLFGMDVLPPHTSALVKRTIAYFHQNYGEPLSRGAVAYAVGVSANYLSQIFRKELGLSPWEYLTRYRVRQAERLLRCTTDSITAIALHVGFEDPGYFGRVFRRETGMSPKAFRASLTAPA